MRQRSAGRALYCGARLRHAQRSQVLFASRPFSSSFTTHDSDAPPLPSASGPAIAGSSPTVAHREKNERPFGHKSRGPHPSPPHRVASHHHPRTATNSSTASPNLPTSPSAASTSTPPSGAAVASTSPASPPAWPEPRGGASQPKRISSLSDLTLQQPPSTATTTTSSSSTSSTSASGAAIPYPRPWFYRESPEVGYIYRHHREPKLAPTPRSVKPLPKLADHWQPLDLTLPQQVVPPPVEIPVARLAHGLDRVVFNEGVHPLTDFSTKDNLFTPFLSKIHQPADINYDAMPPFVTTSKDKILHSLASEQRAKYKGSTSSMSPTLAQIYHLLSGFKGPDLSCLSSNYHHLPSGFTKTSCKPVCLFLRPVDGIYSIDSDPGNIPIATNQILLDLGKSLERMLTTEPEEYKREFLLSGKPTGKYGGPEAYHYLKMGDFLLRSQLDCHEPNIQGEHKTFDLKTRATMRVRTNMDTFAKHLGYKLSSVRGVLNSYEREFYDICRAAMLKYWYQVRIGKMDGIFVCYHNTAEIFGFEYLKAAEMERVLFGNSELAEVAFQAPMRLWQTILNEITARAPPGKTLRVVLNADKHSKELDVFVEPVEFDSGWLEPSTSVSSGEMGMISARTSGYGYINRTIQRSSMLDPTNPEHDMERYEWLKVGKLQPSLNHYKLRLATFLNGRPTLDRPLKHRLGDQLAVFYNLTDVTGATEDSILKMLRFYKSLLSKSLLYEWEEEEDGGEVVEEDEGEVA